MRRRNPQKSVTTRYTVCAVQNSECQIQCFQEIIDGSKSPEITAHSHVINDRSPALYVDFLPTAANSDQSEFLPDIVVVHSDGIVRRLSGNLEEVRWVSPSLPESNATALPPEVLSAHWVSYEDASTALLRKRDDVLKECSLSGSSFLILVSRDGDHQESGLRVDVFDIPRNSRTGLSSASSDQRLRLLVSNPLPQSRRGKLASSLQIDFHAPSARLSISSTNELINYDLSGYVPAISSKLVFDEGHSSLFPLTDTLAAGALRSAVRIYDLNYQSIQVRYELGKRSRGRGKEDNARKAVHFISYFGKISTLVALRGRNLIRFHAARTRAQMNNRPKRGGVLIDVLGHSSYTTARIATQAGAELGPGFSKALFVPDELEKAGWEARRKELDNLVQGQHVEEFERLMAVELQDAAAEEKFQMKKSPLQLPSDAQFVDYDKIHYLLSKVFRSSASTPAISEGNKDVDVVIAFLPPRLFPWLARQNHLGTTKIERALSNHPSQLQLKAGAVAHAIMEEDPSLSLLMEYLQGANLLGLDEAIMVIKMIIDAAVAMAQSRPPTEQLLLEDSHKMALDEPSMKGNDTSAWEIQPNVAAGGWSRDHVTAMNRILETLHSFSPLEITSAIQIYLDNEESLALIQFLRQQLFRSGYTCSFPSSPGVSESGVLSIEATAWALSSCIDALGPLGFLGSASDEHFWQGLVPDLKTEISVALAGIEEAVYLKGILQEMVRYGNAATRTPVLPTNTSKQLKAPGSEAGTIVKVYAEPVEEQSHDLCEASSLLPLSLGVGNTVSETKKRKGGGEVIARTERQLHYLENRSVGRYSFEKLIL
jgi:hypothetical protein